MRALRANDEVIFCQIRVFPQIFSIKVMLLPSSCAFVFSAVLDTGMVKRAAVKIFQHISLLIHSSPQTVTEQSSRANVATATQ